MTGPLGIPGTGSGLPPHWEDQSYFSEPEFDSEYQHQHIHKSKVTSLRKRLQDLFSRVYAFYRPAQFLLSLSLSRILAIRL